MRLLSATHPTLRDNENPLAVQSGAQRGTPPFPSLLSLASIIKASTTQPWPTPNLCVDKSLSSLVQAVVSAVRWLSPLLALVRTARCSLMATLPLSTLAGCNIVVSAKSTQDTPSLPGTIFSVAKEVRRVCRRARFCCLDRRPLLKTRNTRAHIRSRLSVCRRCRSSATCATMRRSTPWYKRQSTNGVGR